jgi:hypothetical protein
MFMALILFLKMYLGGGLAPSGQTVGSFLYTLAGIIGRENDVSIATMDLINIKI